MVRFAPEYITYVLNENFKDAKALFLSPLMAIHYAHLVMLVEQGIVSAADGHRIRLALDSISEDDVQRTQYDGSYEDLKAIAASTAVSGTAGADLHLVLAIVGLWGEDARRRLRFADVAAAERSSRLGALFGMDR